MSLVVKVLIKQIKRSLTKIHYLNELSATRLWTGIRLMKDVWVCLHWKRLIKYDVCRVLFRIKRFLFREKNGVLLWNGSIVIVGFVG